MSFLMQDTLSNEASDYK